MENGNTQNQVSSKSSMLRYMGIFFGGQIPEKVFMLGKILFVAYLFGITREMDAYLVAMTIPTLYLNLFGDTIYMYMLDIFTQHIDRPEYAWEVTNIIVTAAVVLSGVFALAYVALMPLIRGWLAQGLNGSTIELSIRLAVMLSPLFIIYIVQALFKACSEAFHLFGVSSLQSSIANFATIAVLGLLFIGGKPGIAGYVIATLASEVAGAVCYIPQLVKKGFRFKPDFRFMHPELKKHYSYAVSLTVGSGVYKFYIPINRFFMLPLPVGAISAFTYATYLVQVFSSVLRAFVNAVFPSLTIASHSGDKSEVKRYMEMALRAMALVGIPLIVMVVMLRVPLLAILKHGKFDSDALEVAAGATGRLAPCLLLFPMIYLQIRMLTVLRRMRELVLIGAAGMGLIAVLDKLVLLHLAGDGLSGRALRDAGVFLISLGNSAAMALMCVASMAVIVAAIGGMNVKLVWNAVWKSCVAAASCGAAIIAVVFVVDKTLGISGMARYAVILIAGGSAATACSLGVLALLRTTELYDALALVKRKLSHGS